EAVRATLTAAGVQILPGRFLDFLDPWGNRIEIVGYDNIQFTKAPHVLKGMGLTQRAGYQGTKGWRWPDRMQPVRDSMIDTLTEKTCASCARAASRRSSAAQGSP